MGNIPFSMFKYFKRDRLDSDWDNFTTFNFAYVPRIYTVCLGLKLIRIRKAKL